MYVVVEKKHDEKERKKRKYMLCWGLWELKFECPKLFAHKINVYDPRSDALSAYDLSYIR